MKQQWTLSNLLDDPRKRTQLLAAALVVVPIGVIAWLLTVISDANQRSQAASTTDATTSQTSLETPTIPLEPEPSTVAGNINDSQSSLRVEVVQPNVDQAPQTSVEVNGQAIDVPADGTVHKIIQDVNGTTTLDISTSSSASSGTTRSSTDIELNASSESTIKGD